MGKCKKERIYNSKICIIVDNKKQIHLPALRLYLLNVICYFKQSQTEKFCVLVMFETGEENLLYLYVLVVNS